MALEYSTTTKAIIQRTRISDLSSRDKCNLFNDLMDDLGLIAAIQAEPDGCARFQELWKDMMDRNWK